MLIRIVFGCFVVISVLSFKSDAQKVIRDESPDFCATVTAMADLSTEQREATLRNAIVAVVPEAELLLYLHFPPQGGTIVSPGTPNSTGFNSTIINSTRLFPPSTLTPAQMDQIIGFMEDDFSPFNIRITTDYAEFLSYPTGNKLIQIFTTTGSAVGFSGANGVAPFSGIGSRMPSNPSYVFVSTLGDNLINIANVASHEAAHTLGLTHQGQFDSGCINTAEYQPNIGNGPLAFGVIMGMAKDRSISNWYSQDCLHPIFGGPLHDVALISSHVDLRPDDFPDSPGSGRFGEVTALPTNGILGTAGDTDFIRIDLAKDAVLGVVSNNVDVEVSVFETDGTLIGTFNDPDFPGIPFPVTSGPKDIRIRAVSNANMGAQFMTGKFTLKMVPQTEATVSGSVKDLRGRAIANASLRLNGPEGSVRITRSNTFGYYRFENVAPGFGYVIEARHKQYEFVPQPVQLMDEVTTFDITPMPEGFAPPFIN